MAKIINSLEIFPISIQKNKELVFKNALEIGQKTPSQSIKKLAVDDLRYNVGQLRQNSDAKHLPNTCQSINYDVLKSVLKNAPKNAPKTAPKTAVKQTVNIDWFETMLDVKIPLNTFFEDEIALCGGIYLLKDDKGSRFFKDVFHVYYDGENVGKLLVFPKDRKKMKDNRMSFQMANYMLYRNEWTFVYGNLLKALDAVHYSNTRIDAAIDGANKAYVTACYDDTSSRIGRVGKSKIKVTKDNDGQITKYEIGSMASSKYGKIYNKSKVLKKYPKPYIQSFWDSSGLEIKDNEDVYRYEITLRSKYANRYDWQRLDDSAYLASIGRTETKNWFGFFRRKKDKNRAREMRKKIEIFDWASFGGVLLPKNIVKKSEPIYCIKIGIKAFTREQYFDGHRDYEKPIRQAISKYNLEDWYKEKMIYWTKEWNREIRAIKLSKVLLN